jgi:hypothetical protein
MIKTINILMNHLLKDIHKIIQKQNQKLLNVNVTQN